MAILLAAGLLAAALVRSAPGFGMDERMLDVRLSRESRAAVEREGGAPEGVAAYYAGYLRRLVRGDLGVSVSLGRPVRELLAERIGVSVRNGAAGLVLAWSAALAMAMALELVRRRSAEAAASVVAGTLLAIPAAVVALAAMWLGQSPGIAVGAILFPRIFRYVRDLARQACGAPHVLAAHALGVRPARILTRHVAAAVLPELLALAGVSVSMAVGATVPVEALCDSPGVGQLVWQSALSRDLPVLVNLSLLIAAVTVVANLAADSVRWWRDGGFGGAECGA